MENRVGTAQKTWVQQRNYSKQEIIQAEHSARNVLTITKRSYEVAKYQLKTQMSKSEMHVVECEILDIIPGAAHFTIGKKSSSGNLSTLLKPDGLVLVFYRFSSETSGTAHETFARTTSQFTEGKISITSMSYETPLRRSYSYYAEGIDSALVMLSKAFGDTKFAYAVMLDPTWVIAESNGRYKGVFIGDLAYPTLFATDFVAQYEQQIQPGVVFSDEDLSKYLEEYFEPNI